MHCRDEKTNELSTDTVLLRIIKINEICFSFHQCCLDFLYCLSSLCYCCRYINFLYLRYLLCNVVSFHCLTFYISTIKPNSAWYSLKAAAIKFYNDGVLNLPAIKIKCIGSERNTKVHNHKMATLYTQMHACKANRSTAFF